MFNKIKMFVFFSFFILFLAGCGASLTGENGIEPTEILELDDDFDAKATIKKNEVVGLDMRVPTKSGYKLVGASFDPEILKLVHFLVYEDEGQPRAQYMFQGVSDGASSVLVKMEPLAGGDVDIYKVIVVNVGDGNGFFD